MKNRKRFIAIIMALVMGFTASSFITALAAWEDTGDVEEVIVKDDGTVISGDVPSGTIVDSLPTDGDEGDEVWVVEEEVIEEGVTYGTTPDPDEWKFYDGEGKEIDREEVVDFYYDEDEEDYIVIVGYEEGTTTYPDGAFFDEDEGVWKIQVGTDLIPIIGAPEPSVDPATTVEEGQKKTSADNSNKFGASNKGLVDGLKNNHGVVLDVGNNGELKEITVPSGVTVVLTYQVNKGGSEDHYYTVTLIGPLNKYKFDNLLEKGVKINNSWLENAFDNTIKGYDEVPVFDEVEGDYQQGAAIFGTYEFIEGTYPVIGSYIIIKKTYTRFIFTVVAGTVTITDTETGEEYTEEEFFDIIDELIPDEEEEDEFIPVFVPVAAVVVEEDEEITEVPAVITPLAAAPAEEEEEEAAADEEIVDVGGIDIPLAVIGTTNSWHLWNMILSLAGIVLAVAMGIRAIAGNKKKEDDQVDEDAQNRKKSLVLGLMIPATAIAACITFVLTQDLTAPMAMVDQWTALHAGLFAAGLISFIFADRKVEEKEEVKA